jgi:hypothetical protein
MPDFMELYQPMLQAVSRWDRARTILPLIRDTFGDCLSDGRFRQLAEAVKEHETNDKQTELIVEAVGVVLRFVLNPASAFSTDDHIVTIDCHSIGANASAGLLGQARIDAVTKEIAEPKLGNTAETLNGRGNSLRIVWHFIELAAKGSPPSIAAL